MTSRKRATTLLAVLLGAALVLSGCAEDKPDGATAIPAAAPTDAAEENDCEAVPATVEKHLNSSDVDSVVVQGQCTTVVVTTKLDDEDVATARQLCDTAGEVAYTGDINAVSVVSASGEELSNGITGMKCLP